MLHSFEKNACPTLHFRSFFKSSVSELLGEALLLWPHSGHSFVKSNVSELLKSLFKKEPMSEEQHEQFALGHKKREKMSKTDEKYEFFEWIARFFRAICSNRKRITDIALFKRVTTVFHSFKWVMLSKRAKSERVNSQPGWSYRIYFNFFFFRKNYYIFQIYII